MPPVTYALALALAMAGLAIVAGLMLVRGRASGRARRVVTALILVWVAGAVAFETWAFSSPTYRPLMSSLGWVFVGMLVGLRSARGVRTARRRPKEEKRAEGAEGEKRPEGMDAPIPTGAEDALRKLGVRERDILASIAADLTPEGRYTERLVVVTRERLVTLAQADGLADEGDAEYSPGISRDSGNDDPPWEVALDVPVADIEEIHAEALVGGGRLALRTSEVAGPPGVVAHYTNTHAHAYQGLAKKMGEHIAARKKAEDKEKDKEKGEDDGKDDGELDDKEDAKELSFADVGDDKRRNCPTCGRRLPENSEVCRGCVKRGRTILRLLGMSAHYWVQITVLFLLLVAGAALSLVEPYLAGKVLLDDILSDAVLKGERPASFLGLYEGSPATALLLLALTLAGMMLLGVALTIVRSRLAVRVGARVGTDLRARVFHHLQALSLSYYDKQKTGALMSRTDHDTGHLQHFLIEGVQMTAYNLLMMAGIVVTLFALDWRLAIWAMLPAPLLMLFSAFFWRFVIGRFRRLWERVARLSSFLNDSISGVRVVKAFGQEEREKERFDERNISLYQGIISVNRSFATFYPFLGVIMMSGGLLVRYVGGMGVISQYGVEGGMTVGILMAFAGYLWRFYGPLQMITRLNDWLTRSLTAAERVFEVLDTEPGITESGDAVALPELEGKVEIRDVSFGYEKLKPVVKDVSFEVNPGEMIGFVGHSGAGKTTTINLICRLYDVDEGAVLFDGIDVRKIRIGDLRRQIGVVLQETYLFAGTIAQNIAYAQPDARLEDVLESSAAANAHDFVMRRPDGYDSEVGERGGRLSTGEKQRISIARAILHNPKILILDEATSSVDTQTEEQIQLALKRLVKNRTTFAIAHRLSTLRNAHRLVVLENGELKEIGTHDELLAKRGIYHKLVEAQSKMSNVIAVGG
ncbi:MAG: ABC transporter ATP-binding protein [Planctomycetota bacterium]